MSLLNLRKESTPSKAVKCTVDEFIDNAQNYARGFDHVPNTTDREVVSATQVQPPKLPFRKATFTLSEPCIESLTQLAQEAGCAKSHLIRMLIHQLEEASPVEQQLLLSRHKNKG